MLFLWSIIITLLLAVSYLLDYRSYIISLEINDCEAPNLTLLFSTCFGYSRPFTFPNRCETQLVIFHEKAWWDRDWVESIYQPEENCHLNNTESLTTEHSTSIYLGLPQCISEMLFCFSMHMSRAPSVIGISKHFLFFCYYKQYCFLDVRFWPWLVFRRTVPSCWCPAILLHSLVLVALQWIPLDFLSRQ